MLIAFSSFVSFSFMAVHLLIIFTQTVVKGARGLQYVS